MTAEPPWTPPDDLRWICELGCTEPIVGDLETVAAHLFGVHGMESPRWSDGGLVVDDSDVVQPEHFGGFYDF